MSLVFVMDLVFFLLAFHKKFESNDLKLWLKLWRKFVDWVKLICTICIQIFRQLQGKKIKKACPLQYPQKCPLSKFVSFNFRKIYMFFIAFVVFFILPKVFFCFFSLFESLCRCLEAVKFFMWCINVNRFLLNGYFK